MLKMLFETGHPWITFKDPCNLRSPAGPRRRHPQLATSAPRSRSTPARTKPPSATSAPSSSTPTSTADGALDHDMLRETDPRRRARPRQRHRHQLLPDRSRQALATRRHRPIGLGVMGLQNALFKRGLAFASEEAVEFNDEIMEAIAYYAYSASSDLAAERGAYSSYQGSKWDRGLLPQDTVDLLEKERGMQDRRAARRQAWIGRPSATKIKPSRACATATSSPSPPPPRSRTSWAPRPASSRTTRTSSSRRTSPASSSILNAELVRDLKKLGLWNDEMRRPAQVLRRRTRRHRGHPGEHQGEAPHRLRHRLQLHHRRRRAPPEVDRPVADR